MIPTLLVLTATVMFGVQFLFNGLYTDARGGGLRSAMILTAVSSLAGLIPLLAINRFSLSLTPYTVFLALLVALNGLLCNLCNVCALERTNLAVYSLFSMIGGMLLPFAAGIFFFDESLTVALLLCLGFIIVSIAFSTDKSTKRGGIFFCVGVFFFNGMSGVLSMVFTHAAYPVATSADFSVLHTAFRVVLSGFVLAILFTVKAIRKRKGKGLSGTASNDSPASEHKPVARWKVVLYMVLIGVLNTVANYLLLLSLDKLPGSLQYPMVTGGVIICSTVFCYLTPKKPRLREWIAVGVAFCGMLCLLLPI